MIRLVTALALIALLCGSTQTHGELALARPLTGLAVDGDLSDWPGDLPRYALHRVAAGTAPDGDGDLSAHYRVAYDPANLRLFVAVEVHDQSTIVDASADATWNTQDGCELYLGSADSAESIQQYALWGDRTTSAGGAVDLAFRRDGAAHHYEWSFDLDARAGDVLPMDVAVNDRDRDGSFTSLKWGSANAEIILLPPDLETATLRGTVRWVAGDVIPRAHVEIQGAEHTRWRWTVRTDRDGRFALELPQALYRLSAASAPTSLYWLGADGLTVELVVLRETATAAPLGAGVTVEAGAGVTVEASFGIQKGLWRTYGLPDGLHSTIVDAIYQDRAGYLWFGTQGGVSRYDGTHFTTYTTQDGLAYNGVSAIAEDVNGHLWFGTWGGGISRYDGTRFTTYTTQDGLAHDVILAIGKGADGHLWFGTQGGLNRYDGRDITTYTTRDGLAHDEISAITADAEGRLWFGTWGGGVSRYDGAPQGSALQSGTGPRFITYTAQDGLAHDEISAIAADAEGHLWFGTQGGVSRYDDGSFTTYTTRDGLTHDAISSIAVDRRGQLWFGTWERGISRYDGRTFTTYTAEDGLAHDEVSRIAADGDGQLWFGTWGGGVSRYDGANTTHYDERNGLADDATCCLLEDRDGRVWIGTQNGLSRHDDGGFATYTTREGLAHDAVTALAEDRDGRVWIGTQNGLSRYDDGGFTTYTTREGLAHDWVNCIVEDAEGRLWFGTWGGGVSRYDDGGFTTYTAQDGLGHDWINTALAAPDGALWFGTKGGGLSRWDGQAFHNLTSDDGLAANWIWAMALDRDGVLWLGTDNGVSRYDSRTFQTLTSKDGLSSDKISAILEDGRGRLWFGTRGGGATIYDGAVLQDMLVRDGLTDNIVTDLLADARGRIWIGTGRGVTLLRPSADPAPIHLVDVVADRRLGAVADISVSAAQDYLAFEYRGVSFKTRPGALVYRYRLAGHDADWRRTNLERVEYHDLPVGDYTFEVGAIDRDLVHSAAPVSVQVRVHPPYGDIALYSALFLAALGLVWAVGQIVQRNRRLEVARRAAEEARQEADDANEAKSTFLANMSHEIRTPMNGIVGMVDMMRRTSLEKNQHNYLSVIDTSADALLELINDILDLSKIEAGSMDLEETDFALWEVLEGVMKLMAMRAHEKGLELACHVAPDAPVHLVGDPTRLRQIIVNLIGNAIKFTAEGEVVVEVRLQTQTPDGVELHIGVRDTGIGIPKDKQDLIFEAFSQADSSTTRQFGGTGLGLNISRQLVELMQGRIWLESEEGRGSTFQFTARFGLAAPTVDAPWEKLPDTRVLAAVANATNRAILADLLGQWGCATTLCATGEEALAALAQTDAPYHLAILDPPGDRLELADRMRAQPGLEFLLLLTALDDQDALDRAVAAGIRHHLRKPLTPTDLLDAIATARGVDLGLGDRAESEAERLPPLAILLADDNPTNRYVATSMLEEAGHRVATADDGRQALAQWAEEPFDLILMDVQMPEMDGYEATGAIRAEEEKTGGHMPIIGLTANAMKGDREACIAAGMDEYVPKPVRWEVLRQTIAKLGVEGGVLPPDYAPARPAPVDVEPEAPPAEEAPPDTVLDLHALANLRAMEARGAISVAKMIALFYDSGEQLVPALSQSLADADGEVLTRQAHTLKGSAGYIGARKLSTLCQELETRGKAGQLDGADALIAEIDTAFEEVRAAIAEQVPEAAEQDEAPATDSDWSPEDLDPAAKAKMPALLSALEGEMERWEELYKTMTITEIESLGAALAELGEEYAYPPLVTWAQNVETCAQNFDMDGLQAAYEAYPELIETTRALAD